MRRQRRRFVERADADEAKLRNATVNAPYCYLAGGAAMDFVRTAAVSRHCDWFWIAGEQDDPVCLDERIEHEGASSLPLAIEAMTAVHEHRRGVEPKRDRSTVRATPSTINSAIASPVAGAFRIPQTLCPVAT